MRTIPRPPRAVLFDMDGVLVDSFDAWVAVIDALRERRGLAPVGPAGVRAVWGQGIAQDCVNLFPGAEPAELAAAYGDEFARQLSQARAEPGALELAFAFRRAGARLAVVTNSPRVLALPLLDATGFGGVFETVAGGDEGPGKPAPDLVRLALARLGARAEDAVMIGDTDNDVAAARAAGVAVIGYGVAGDAEVARLSDVLPLVGLG